MFYLRFGHILELLVVLFLLLLVRGCEKNDDFNEYQNKYTRSCVNLINERSIQFDRKLNDKGQVIKKGNRESLVTGYVNVFLGDLWYEKVIYLQTCCELNGIYGFSSQRVVFYDEKKDAILDKVVDNPRTAIKIPDGARYARIQYPSEATKLYAAVTNRSIINAYSKYDERLFYRAQNEGFHSVVNSDGAISLLLKTGFDYLGRYAADMGYGCYHTAFNTDCIKDISYDGSYQGEKYQIDCSSFVLAALLGITYNNSRYVLGNEQENLATPGAFVFDQYAEYNYYMQAFPSESGADRGRMYANKIAKYFYDRGLLFEISPDFSNVNTGDLLFWGSGNLNSDFFLGIGHVAICSDSWLRKGGGKGIRIIQALNEEECDYTAELKFAARVPLPYINSTEKDLIEGFIPLEKEIHLSKGEQQPIMSLDIHEELKNHNIYSLFIETALPDNISLICKVNNGKTVVGSCDSSEVYISDNMIEKHFGFYRNEMKPDNKKLYLYIYARDNYSGKIQISNAKLYEGYHSRKD